MVTPLLEGGVRFVHGKRLTHGVRNAQEGIAGRRAHDGAAVSGAPTTAATTSRQQLLPAGPDRAARSAHAPVGSTAAVRRPAHDPSGRRHRKISRAPLPSPPALAYAHNDDAVGRRAAGHVNPGEWPPLVGGPGAVGSGTEAGAHGRRRAAGPAVRAA